MTDGGFKYSVSLVSAIESVTADPQNPSPPGITRLVLRLNLHNMQTDRPAPIINLSGLMLMVDTKNLPGITMTKGLAPRDEPHPDCQAWGDKNAGGRKGAESWQGIGEIRDDWMQAAPNLCQLTLSLQSPGGTIPAGGDAAQDLISGPLPDSLPVTVFQLAEQTGKPPYTPAIPLR
jgi:hypothetical protein